MSATDGVGGVAPCSDSIVSAISPAVHISMANPRASGTARPVRPPRARPNASAQRMTSKPSTPQPSSQVEYAPAGRTISETRNPASTQPSSP